MRNPTYLGRYGRCFVCSASHWSLDVSNRVEYGCMVSITWEESLLPVQFWPNTFSRGCGQLSSVGNGHKRTTIDDFLTECKLHFWMFTPRRNTSGKDNQKNNNKPLWKVYESRSQLLSQKRFDGWKGPEGLLDNLVTLIHYGHSHHLLRSHPEKIYKSFRQNPTPVLHLTVGWLTCKTAIIGEGGGFEETKKRRGLVQGATSKTSISSTKNVFVVVKYRSSSPTELP
jgi:hypothetical protein